MLTWGSLPFRSPTFVLFHSTPTSVRANICCYRSSQVTPRTMQVWISSINFHITDVCCHRFRWHVLAHCFTVSSTDTRFLFADSYMLGWLIPFCSGKFRCQRRWKQYQEHWDVGRTFCPGLILLWSGIQTIRYLFIYFSYDISVGHQWSEWT